MRSNVLRCIPLPNRRPRFLEAFGVALALRVLALIVLVFPRHWGDPGLDFGAELGTIARNLAEGRGFSDPYGIGSRPSAALGPIAPGLWALVFQLCGVQSQLALVVLHGLEACFSALSCALEVEIVCWICAREPRLPRGLPWLLLAILACAPDTLVGLRHLWYDGLQAAVLALTVLLCMRRRAQPTLFRGALLGLATGVLALVNPTPALFVAASLALDLIPAAERARQAASAACVVLGCALVVGPWTLRNYRVLGVWIPVRSNFGQELLQGNGPRGEARQTSTAQHPAVDPVERRLLGERGEVRHAEICTRLALEHIRAHPLEFLARTAQRVYLYWCSDLFDQWRWNASDPPWWEQGPGAWVRRSLIAAWTLAPLVVLLLALLARPPGFSVPCARELVLLLLSLGTVYALLHVLPNYAALARPYLWMLACLVWAARGGARERESAAA